MIGYESWYQKTGVSALPGGENCVIVRSFVLSQYQRVTDGQTNTSRCSIAEHNKKEQISRKPLLYVPNVIGYRLQSKSNVFARGQHQRCTERRQEPSCEQRQCVQLLMPNNARNSMEPAVTKPST